MAKHQQHQKATPEAPPPPVVVGTAVGPDRFKGARRVWVAAKGFPSGGRVWNPGDLIPDAENHQGFHNMQRNKYVDAMAQLADGALVPHPMAVKRLIHKGGKAFLPSRLKGKGLGDILPGVRTWGNFGELWRNGWFEPVNPERLEMALRLEG